MTDTCVAHTASADQGAAANGRTVPLTIALINLVHAMQAAQKLYIAEAIMAEQLGTPAPKDDYWARLQTLFFDTYAAQVDATGLPRTLDGFGAVMKARITPGMRRVHISQLPTTYALSLDGVRCGEIVQL